MNDSLVSYAGHLVDKFEENLAAIAGAHQAGITCL